MSDWITAEPADLLMVLVSALGAYIVLVALTRISGIRSFSKMSGFDFAITVAIGSVIASIVIAKTPPLIQGAFALLALYSIQMTVAEIRKRSGWFRGIVDNRPRLIMSGGTIHEDQMKKAKITTDDLFAKLREANVTQMNQVFAVIAETTGDISVLHGPPETGLAPELLDNVIAAERYKSPVAHL